MGARRCGSKFEPQHQRKSTPFRSFQRLGPGHSVGLGFVEVARLSHLGVLDVLSLENQPLEPQRTVLVRVRPERPVGGTALRAH